MFGLMVHKNYVGGYSPEYNLITYVGKTQAKRFHSQEDVYTFIDTHKIMVYEIVKL